MSRTRRYLPPFQRDDLSFELTQEFLQQVLIERERRATQKQPVIDSITPGEFPAGETTPVEIRGRNLERVEIIEVSEDNLVEVVIDRKEPDLITNAQKLY